MEIKKAIGIGIGIAGAYAYGRFAQFKVIQDKLDAGKVFIAVKDGEQLIATGNPDVIPNKLLDELLDKRKEEQEVPE